MRNQLILATLAALETRAISIGHPHSSGDITGCECVDHTDREVNADGFIEYLHTDNKVYLFPANYGTNRCDAWDSWRAPWCNDPSDQSDFCDKQWCYVEPDTCHASDVKLSSFDPGHAYSYLTCNNEAEFTADIRPFVPTDNSGSGDDTVDVHVREYIYADGSKKVVTRTTTTLEDGTIVTENMVEYFDVNGELTTIVQPVDSSTVLVREIPTCECQENNGLSFVLNDMNLPVNYGFGGCDTHDDGVAASGCATNQADHCLQSWCYVTVECANQLGADATPSTVLNNPFSYSYANCGSQESSADPPSLCGLNDSCREGE